MKEDKPNYRQFMVRGTTDADLERHMAGTIVRDFVLGKPVPAEITDEVRDQVKRIAQLKGVDIPEVEEVLCIKDT